MLATKKSSRIYANANTGGNPVQDNQKFWEFKASAEQEDEVELLLYGVLGEDEGWDDVTSKAFVSELNQYKDAKTIYLRINSPGGDVPAGLAIHNNLKRHNATIIGYNDGWTASIATVVAAACDKFISPLNAVLMFHKPWTGNKGNANTMRETADVLDVWEAGMIEAYKEKTGLSDEKIKEILHGKDGNGTWMKPEEALKLGFVDEIEQRQIAACIKDNSLEINGQKLSIKNIKKFNIASWYTEEVGAKVLEDPAEQTIPKAEDKVVTVVKKTKGKTTMNLEKLCAALGLDYKALINAGMSEEAIKAMVSAKMQESEGDDGKGVNANVEVGVKAEKQRAADILKLGETYNAKDLAIKFVSDGKSIEDFKDELLKGQGGAEQKPLDSSRGSFGIGMSVEEAQNFSFLNLISALSSPNDSEAQKRATKEFEYCEAAAAKYGVKNKGIVIPVEALLVPLVPKANLDTTTGAPLIATTLLTGSFIDLLRNKCVILQLARQLTGLVGNVDIPRQTAGASGYWVGEDTAPTPSNATFDALQLRMKTVAGNTYLTRSMIKQTSIGMEAFAREDIAAALGLAIDKAAFYGSGSTNQPKGLANIDGINTVNFAGVNPTYTELVQMETEIGLDNAAVESMAYVVNAGTKGHCKSTQKFPNDANTGGTIWEKGGTINDYKAAVTNQIATGDVFLGNFADFILGMFGGLEILVDPYTYSSKGAIQVTGFQDVDYGARHAASFCLGKKGS